MSEPQILTRDPELSRLAALALNDGVRGDWFTARPRNPAEWVAQIDSVRAEFVHRSWRGSLAPALSTTGAAAERLARVAAAGGAVVTTGQQPGLFGGPIYTFSKALGTLALADALEAATGIPVAPVFWAATYDADFAEASVTYLASGDHVERLRMTPPELPPRGMSETPLGDVTPLLRLLERGTGAAADPGVMALVRAAYHEGATVGDAFVSLLRALLEPLGIAVLDAGQACVRQAERPLMLRALRDAAHVDAAVRARDDMLRREG
ncbi:MAG: bacillithiol biosynthesis protein BshC, partial [Gemmatimonadaceae bacterium]